MRVKPCWTRTIFAIPTSALLRLYNITMLLFKEPWLGTEVPWAASTLKWKSLALTAMSTLLPSLGQCLLMFFFVLLNFKQFTWIKVYPPGVAKQEFPCGGVVKTAVGFFLFFLWCWKGAPYESLYCVYLYFVYSTVIFWETCGILVVSL